MRTKKAKYGTYMSSRGPSFHPSAPYDALSPLPPPAHVTDSVPVLRREADARQALAELKGMANIIPNQAILINAIALREAKDSSEVENIVTTRDRLYRALDGNGRTGRILNVLYLILKGYLDIPILYPSSYIIEHKDDYYRFLRGVTAAGEWEQWILFMLEAIRATSMDAIRRVREIRNELDRTVDEVRAALPRIYTKELVETLFVHPYSKIDFLVNATGVERKAVSRYLQSLEDLGLLESQKVGREKIYINIRLMTILSCEIAA